MTYNLNYWKRVYNKHKHKALCLDIEVDREGNITVVGLYKPKDGPVEAKSFAKGINLNHQTLKEEFKDCELLITFNGLKWDIPKIKEKFPGVMPNVKVIDLYLIARQLNYNTNLKVLENTMRIERPEDLQNKRRIAMKMWYRYIKYNDEQAFNTLIEYNQQDAINLYPLAEELMAKIE